MRSPLAAGVPFPGLTVLMTSLVSLGLAGPACGCICATAVGSGALDPSLLQAAPKVRKRAHHRGKANLFTLKTLPPRYNLWAMARKQTAKTSEGTRQINNRRARFDYEIVETMEAGIEL